MSNATIGIIRDMTEYKYKFFTNLQSFSIDTDKSAEENLKAFDNPEIYWAVCVKECPSGDKVDTDEKIDCMVNNDVKECPTYKNNKLANVFYDTKLTYNYCVPQADEAKEIVLEMYKELDENVGGFGNYINDIKDAWFVMVVMVVVSFLLTTFYVWLLQIITKPLLYTSLLLIFLLGCGTGYFAYTET